MARQALNIYFVSLHLMFLSDMLWHSSNSLLWNHILGLGGNEINISPAPHSSHCTWCIRTMFLIEKYQVELLYQPSASGNSLLILQVEKPELFIISSVPGKVTEKDLNFFLRHKKLPPRWLNRTSLFLLHVYVVVSALYYAISCLRDDTRRHPWWLHSQWNRIIPNG